MTRAAVTAWLLRLLAAAGLGVDAGIHIHLAPSQPPGGTISQIDLFYLEGAVSSLALLLVLATGARLVYAVAVLVAASALGAVLLYRYVDVGTLGPLPNMYEPFWYPAKTATAIAEAVALILAAAGTVLPRPARTATHGLRPAPEHAPITPG